MPVDLGFKLKPLAYSGLRYGIQALWWFRDLMSMNPKPINPTVNPIKLETGLRPNSAGIPYTLFLRIEAMGFPTFRRLL